MGLIKTLPQSNVQFYSQFRSSSNLRDHNHQLYVSLKPPLWTIETLHPQSMPKYPFHLTKLQVSPKPTAPSPPVSRMPISNLSKITQRLAKFLSEKILISLVGALVFMGSFGFNTRIGLPLIAQAIMEEKRDTKMENSEKEQLWDKLLEREPRNVEALKVVVHSKMSNGQVKDALEYVRRLIEIEPREVEWRLLEALCYEMMGQLGKAKKLFKEILKQMPLLLRALHGLAMVMHKNFEGPAVFEMLNNALELARHDKRVTEERNIRILIAQMHVVKGELEEGLKKFQDLVSDNPRDFRPYLCQGIIYSLLDRQEEAAEQLAMYRSLMPEEFPQKRYLDDVVFAAKSKSRENLQKEFEAELSKRKYRTSSQRKSEDV